MANLYSNKLLNFDEDHIRNMVCVALKNINSNFSKEYGDLVIASDSYHSWRKEIFPNYKSKRKETQEVSDIDWEEVFKILNKIKLEVKDNFPYKFLMIDYAEADDIIASLVFEHKDEKILIISRDKDFLQLHINKNINQYDHVSKKFISHENPSKFLKEHIIKGDSGDSVPNILSADDVFVTKTRQKSITSEKLDYYLNNEIEDENIKKNFDRNNLLINLSCIPQHIQDKIIDEYKTKQIPNKKILFNYFIKNKMTNILECINDF